MPLEIRVLIKRLRQGLRELRSRFSGSLHSSITLSLRLSNSSSSRFSRTPTLPHSLIFLLSSFLPVYAQQGIPLPSQMAVNFTVSGRTSTLKYVEVANVGQKIPITFSKKRVGNTDGFTWWVSRHYALKTDYKEGRARHFLDLLEMAYPHYVEVFGREPPGIEHKRMAVIYAASQKQLDKALRSDGIVWNFRGGGITYDGIMASYIYPSGTLTYHHRYILLHEATHLFQMTFNGGTCFTMPGWYIEGVAAAFGHLVYDDKKRQLTLNVFDKATTGNMLDNGLRDYRKKPRTLLEMHGGDTSRGLGFVIFNFFNTDPERVHKFRIWRDEMFRMHKFGQERYTASEKLLQELFGSWDALNADFKKWIEARQQSFSYKEWGWEQNADTLWSYGFAGGGKLSRTDYYFPPGDKPAYDPLCMDYPATQIPDIVGPVQRGVSEPSVGAVIDFLRNPNGGISGIGLGVTEGPELVPIDGEMLFTDPEGKKKGVSVTAHQLAKVKGNGLNSEEVVSGKLIG